MRPLFGCLRLLRVEVWSRVEVWDGVEVWGRVMVFWFFRLRWSLGIFLFVRLLYVYPYYGSNVWLVWGGGFFLSFVF